MTLPSPEARPDADIVVYDGFCRFCHAQMSILHRADLFRSLAFVSLHDERSNWLLPDWTFERKMREMVVIDHDGRFHAGASAIRYLSRRLPLLWWIAIPLHIPGTMGLWRQLYRWVADSRYRFGRRDCEGGTCHLHGYGGGES